MEDLSGILKEPYRIFMHLIGGFTTTFVLLNGGIGLYRERMRG